VVSFKNAIIILTSNLGSAEIFNAAYKQKKEGGQVAGELLDSTGCAGQYMSLQQPCVAALPRCAELSAVIV
jgi:hypothetical protein